MGAMASCDNIDENNRLLDYEKPESQKNVLVMEFSGQLCSNCPSGAETLHGLIEQYPGQVIVVGCHPTNTQYTNVSASVDLGLATEVAREYYDYFKPDAFPAATIDGGNVTSAYDTWGGLVMEAMKSEAPATLTMLTDYDPSSRTLNIDYACEFTDVYNGELKVVLWITESDIVGFQLGKQPIMDYVHNHVLRAAVNGTWGTPLAEEGEVLKSFIPAQSVTGSASIVLDEKWVAENCHVVGALFDAGNHSMQVQQTSVVD